jgi:Sec-independent protein secretion pathway component TatC
VNLAKHGNVVFASFLVGMLLLMVPQIILYAVGIWLASVFGRPAPWASQTTSAEVTETSA